DLYNLRSRNWANAFPASKNARSTFRSKFRRSLISCSVNSGTSTALTVIVAEPGSSCWEISSFTELAAEIESVVQQK
ncbi:hypothetical protein H6G97_40215, partial [Nostoc flagelliforme FACHB-838]